MKIQRTDAGALNVTLRVELEPSEFETCLDIAAKQLSKHMKADGFRSGHMPRAVVEDRFGSKVVQDEARRVAVDRFASQAMQRESIRSIQRPSVSFGEEGETAQNVGVQEDGSMVFEVSTVMMPQITLPDLATVEVTQETPRVSNAEIEETLTVLRNQRAQTVPVERAAAMGDVVTIDFVGRKGKVKVEGAQGQGYPLELGSGQFIPGFEENLVGMKKGETTSFEIEFPKEYHKKELAGTPVTFEVTAQEVAEKSVPEANDAFAQSLGNFESLQALKSQIEANMLEEKLTASQQAFREHALEAVAKRVDSTLPDSVIDQELDAMLEDMESRLHSQGGSLEAYFESIQSSPEAFRKENRDQALLRVKVQLVLTSLIEAQQLTPDKKEVDREHRALQRQYRDNRRLLNHVKSAAFKRSIADRMARQKAVEYLLSQVTIKQVQAPKPKEEKKGTRNTKKQATKSAQKNVQPEGVEKGKK